MFTYMLGNGGIGAASDRDMVRLLLNDVDDDTHVFEDSELDAFLALEGGNVKRAAAQAIDTNADDQALASKVLRTQDLTTDGAKLADSLRKRAAELRRQADDDDEDGDAGFFFGVTDIVGPASGPELAEWPHRWGV